MKRTPLPSPLVPALVVLILATAHSNAQKAPPAPQPNPQAPNLHPVAPLGMQRGTTLELTLTGTNLANPTGVLTGFPATVTIPTDNKNGTEAAKLRVRLEVPKDAPLGFHAFRMATAKGMSNTRIFCIDDLPQVTEVDTNRSKSTPQAVPVPGVVVGKADAEASDYYQVTVSAGQRVTFEILGRRLGSAIDPQLLLFDAKTGRELPGGYSNDAPGCQTDPRLTYTFKEAGNYLVEVRDVMFRGGPDFGYRLRIGDFPCATTPIPMAAKRGTKAPVNFAGPVADGLAPVEVDVPTGPAVTTVWVTPRGANGLSGWPVALAVSDNDESVEQEPNNEPAKANRLTAPVGVTGRFQQPGDLDHFVFAAKKGQKYTVEATTQELYSPSEVYLVARDAKGTQVGASNPAAAARLEFTASADGDYTVSVEHLLYWGNPSETYHLAIRPSEPGFDLTLALDRWDAAQTGTVTLPIQVTRRDYTGPIELSVTGPPGIKGTGTIAAGQAAGNVTVTPAADVPVGPYILRLQGKATVNGKAVVDTVSVRAPVSASLGALAYPPRNLHEETTLAVTEKPPFTLAMKFDQPDGLRGVPVALTVSAARAPGFTEEITLAAGPLPANVTAALKPIAKGTNDTKVSLTAAAAAALGKFPVTVVGKTKVGNKEFTVNSAPATLVLVAPFELKVEPAPVKLAAGDKAKLKVKATRRGGYQGPIALEVKNLPANVTAAKATVDAGKDEAEIEVSAAAGAAAGDKADVNVQGTAPAAGNQQVSSANFTVSVGKK